MQRKEMEQKKKNTMDSKQSVPEKRKLQEDVVNYEEFEERKAEEEVQCFYPTIHEVLLILSKPWP